MGSTGTANGRSSAPSSAASRSTAIRSRSCSASRGFHHPAAVTHPGQAQARLASQCPFGNIVGRAVVRLVGALMLEQSDEWAVGRRYFSLESLASLTDTDPRKLSTMAA